MAVEVYRRRRPEHSTLYQVVSDQLATFMAVTESADRALPRHVADELESYLHCGILAHGFARVRCSGCGFDRLVAFSCKGRGFCPSCLGRHMADTAAYLVDNVIPQVPMRQWVLSLPPPLRYLLAWSTRLCSQILAAFVGEIHRWLAATAKRQLALRSVKQAHSGSVTVIQRCSSHLALNIHFHTLVADGVFVQERPTDKPVFRALPEPTPAEIAHVAWQTCLRTIALLRKQGMWLDIDPSEDRLAQDEPGLAQLYGASVAGTLALGPRAGQRLLRFRGQAAKVAPDPVQVIQTPGYGFNVHAGTRISAHDRKGLERLCRYILRPPFAQDRLKLLPDGLVSLQLKRPFSDGTTHVVFEPLDFLGKLAALVPPRRMHRTRFHGVFSSHAKLRSQVVPTPSDPGDHQPATACQTDSTPPCPPCRHRRLNWAQLMRRVFAIDVLACPRCASPMQIIALVTETRVIQQILTAVGHPADSPPRGPVRVPQQLEFDVA